MALLAGSAIAPLMRARILVPVTREAVGGQTHLAGGLHVAGRAFGPGMPATQRKLRAAVIEPLHAPSHGGVALAAIGAEIAPVGIVVAVALDARRRRAVVAFARMTRHTSRVQMRAHERKLRV